MKKSQKENRFAGRVRFACGFFLCLLVMGGCSSPPVANDAGVGNNGMSGFECGPQAFEPSSCQRANFQRPENGWCQGFLLDGGDPGNPGDDTETPVPDEDANSWRCVECLEDSDCMAGSACGNGECGFSGSEEDVGIDSGADVSGPSHDVGLDGA